MKRPDGITLLALWHFLNAVCCTIGALVLLVAMLGVLFGTRDTIAGFVIGSTVLVFAFALVSVLAVLFLVVGLGLWRMRPWARTGAIVLAALQLLNFPIGTVVGGIILWYLLGHPTGKTLLQGEPEAGAA